MTTTASFPSEHHLTNGYSPSTSAYTNGHDSSMDGRQGEYSQSGLSSPYQQQYSVQHSEDPADATSVSHYTPGQDVKFNPSATPTSEYGMNPSPVRSAQYQEYMSRPQFPDGAQRYHHNPVAQPAGPGHVSTPASPSMPTPDGVAPVGDLLEDSEPLSNIDQPVDPAMPAPPAQQYPQQYYPQQAQQHEAPHYAHPQHPMYPPHAGYAPQYNGGPQHHPVSAYGQHVGPHLSQQAPPMQQQQQPMVAPGMRPPGGGQPLSTVYSFVPIPGTHQQKRPRRRFEEIERMYKCGWNGCEKAYGTLNHLNAHVTMQSHGTKRTPEEFKEIRKEWKQRKKEDDNARKVEEERQRQHNHAAAAAAAASQPGVPVDGQHVGHVGHMVHDGLPQGHTGYHPQVRHLPPPMGYAPANSAVHTPYVGQSPVEGMPQYHGAGMAGYYPQSPYGGSSQMYQSSGDNSPDEQ